MRRWLTFILGLLAASAFAYAPAPKVVFTQIGDNRLVLVTANYDYGPFGELVRAEGPMAKANPFRFSTKYQDDESDFLYYGYRYLANGRWLNRDPIEESGGLNLYAFVGNDGVNQVDGLGMYYNSLNTPQGQMALAWAMASSVGTGIGIRALDEASTQLGENWDDPCRRWTFDGNRLSSAMYNPYAMAVDAMLGPLFGKGVDAATTFFANRARNSVGAAVVNATPKLAGQSAGAGAGSGLPKPNPYGDLVAGGEFLDDFAGLANDAAKRKWGTYFFGDDVVPFIDKPNATLGQAGKSHFFAPLDDVASVSSVGDAARASGQAPSITSAYKAGGTGYGVSFPTDGLPVRLPTALDSGGNPNFLLGGKTAVSLEGQSGYLLNSTREFITPGGNPMPPGSVLFQIGPSGSWIPLRKF